MKKMYWLILTSILVLLAMLIVLLRFKAQSVSTLPLAFSDQQQCEQISGETCSQVDCQFMPKKEVWADLCADDGQTFWLPAKVLKFSTKETCEAVSKSACTYLMCDYVPAGQNFDEVCGEIGKGWRPAPK